MSLFIILIFLTACHSGSEPLVPEVPNTDLKVISFSGSETEEQAVSNGTRANRAARPLNETATAFTVWGYKNMDYDAGSYDDDGTTLQLVFPGYAVNWQANSAATTTTNSSNWEYILLAHPEQTVKYWDFAAKAYRYFGATNWEGESAGPYAAYKTYGAEGTYGSVGTYWTSGPYKTYKVSMLADASSAEEMEKTPYFTRLWFSTGDPIAYADKQFGKPVQLEFLKPYARVRFLFKYSYESEGIKIRSKSFQPTADLTCAAGDSVKIILKGTFTVIYPLTGTETREGFTMTPNEDKSTRLAAFTEEYVPDGGPLKEKWYSVLPNNTQGSYTMSVLMNNDAEPKTAVVPAEYMQWQPGYSYTYIFKILDEGGVEIEDVQAAMTPWQEMDADWTVYNW